MGSTRLPGKALTNLAGYPMLSVLTKRVLPSKMMGSFIIATTNLPGDDPIALVADQFNLNCYRGAVDDCLDRIYQAAAAHKPDIVVRLTGDNPFVDCRIVDYVITAFRGEPSCDYMYLGKTFPLGLSVEVLTFKALEEAWKEERDPDSREHVTPYIINNAERFKVKVLSSVEDYSHMRWTVDTPEDLDFAQCVFKAFGNIDFSWQEAAAEINAHPEWMSLNKHIKQRTVHIGDNGSK